MIGSDGVAVITGGAGGIGLGMARACAERGMRVATADLDTDRVEGAAAELRAGGATVSAHRCDVREPAQLDDLRRAVVTEWGGVDLVCNNAGLGLARPVTECRDADWSLLFEINVTGVINGIRSFLPLLIEQGRGHLSATASLSGLIGDPELVIYNGTKFAVVGMMEALALELRRDHPGLSASVLCPGPVATDLLATSGRVLSSGGSTPDERPDVAGYLAAGASPDDVGRLAIDGIAEGRFWLLPHPELTFGLLDDRLAAMKQGRLHVADDWTTQG